jgi:molybdopterin synthase catalytic subunit
MITIRVSPDAFETGAEIAALGSDGIGAVASFTGFVRRDSGLTALTLEHYPAMTEAALRALADQAAARW